MVESSAIDGVLVVEENISREYRDAFSEHDIRYLYRLNGMLAY